jgi:hypothetical protein
MFLSRSSLSCPLRRINHVSYNKTWFRQNVDHVFMFASTATAFNVQNYEIH